MLRDQSQELNDNDVSPQSTSRRDYHLQSNYMGSKTNEKEKKSNSSFILAANGIVSTSSPDVF